MPTTRETINRIELTGITGWISKGKTTLPDGSTRRQAYFMITTKSRDPRRVTQSTIRIKAMAIEGPGIDPDFFNHDMNLPVSIKGCLDVTASMTSSGRKLNTTKIVVETLNIVGKETAYKRVGHYNDIEDIRFLVELKNPDNIVSYWRNGMGKFSPASSDNDVMTVTDIELDERMKLTSDGKYLVAVDLNSKLDDNKYDGNSFIDIYEKI